MTTNAEQEEYEAATRDCVLAMARAQGRWLISQYTDEELDSVIYTLNLYPERVSLCWLPCTESADRDLITLIEGGYGKESELRIRSAHAFAHEANGWAFENVALVRSVVIDEIRQMKKRREIAAGDRVLADIATPPEVAS